MESVGKSAIPDFPQAVTEASRVNDFFNFFAPTDFARELGGKDVLDFGSGYGGRTVEYARRFRCRFVWGVEPFTGLVSESRRYASREDVPNVGFEVCGQQTIPLPDSSIDVVVSYDVLEHVADPIASMRELHRVLRPSGRAFLVFPVYLGAFSHHLDYISLLPGLHWIFSAKTLVEAINEILESEYGRRFGTSRQPNPSLAFDKSRIVLPTLNGLGGQHLKALTAGFEVLHCNRHSWIRRRKPQGEMMKRFSSLPMPMTLLDAATSSVSFVLAKPAAPAVDRLTR